MYVFANASCGVGWVTVDPSLIVTPAQALVATTAQKPIVCCKFNLVHSISPGVDRCFREGCCTHYTALYVRSCTRSPTPCLPVVVERPSHLPGLSVYSPRTQAIDIESAHQSPKVYKLGPPHQTINSTGRLWRPCTQGKGTGGSDTGCKESQRPKHPSRREKNKQR